MREPEEKENFGFLFFQLRGPCKMREEFFQLFETGKRKVDRKREYWFLRSRNAYVFSRCELLSANDILYNSQVQYLHDRQKDRAMYALANWPMRIRGVRCKPKICGIFSSVVKIGKNLGVCKGY